MASSTGTELKNQTGLCALSPQLHNQGTLKECKPSIFWNFEEAAKQCPKLRYWCAPMVGQSELAFRMMTRHFGVGICSTPMINAAGYVASERYRKLFKWSPQDRPLIVQFCGDKSADFLAASRLVENYCDAVELNLGCPQITAKRGHYGAFLMEELELVKEIVSTLRKCLCIPVLCKIRVFASFEKTLEFALGLQEAGCCVLTVHGRTRQEKRASQFLARWDYIRRLKETLSIPVISNGNIREFSDIDRCLKDTGADGVMSAHTLLLNPALFSGQKLSLSELALCYLDYAETYAAEATQIAEHLIRILRTKRYRKNENLHSTLLLLQKDSSALDFGTLRRLIVNATNTSY